MTAAVRAIMAQGGRLSTIIRPTLGNCYDPVPGSDGATAAASNFSNFTTNSSGANDVCILCLATGTKFRASLADVKLMPGAIRLMLEGLDGYEAETEIPVAGATDNPLAAFLTFLLSRPCACTAGPSR